MTPMSFLGHIFYFCLDAFVEVDDEHVWKTFHRSESFVYNRNICCRTHITEA